MWNLETTACRGLHAAFITVTFSRMTERDTRYSRHVSFCSFRLVDGTGMAFLNLQRVFAPRLCASIPTIVRPLLKRNVHLALRELPERPIAPKRDPTKFQSGIGPHARPVENIQTAEDFLKAIGRESETKLKVEWDELWKMDGRAMREAGVGTRDRRYLCVCASK